MDAMDAFDGLYSKFLNQKALDNRVPISGTFELLPFCNMRCKMCYIVHDRPKNWQNTLHSVDHWENLFDQAIEQGMLYALITGGEPFLYPGFQELMERLAKKPIHIALNTNATLLNEERVKWLKSLGLGRINISLYGGSNETYARLCGNPQGFDQVTNAFRLLNEYKVPFMVHTTMTPYNVDDYDAIRAVCNEYRAPLKMVYYMFPPYRKDKGLIENDARFTPEQAVDVALRMLADGHGGDHRAFLNQLELHCAAFENPRIYGAYGRQDILCRSGYSTFWVDWRGQVSGCGVHAAEKIDLSQVPFADAWKQLVSTTEATRLSEKCAYCRYRCICPVCAAAAYCETGDVAGTPDYLCRFCELYARKLVEKRDELRKLYE